jgi:hypothetical protein
MNAAIGWDSIELMGGAKFRALSKMRGLLATVTE